MADAAKDTVLERLTRIEADVRSWKRIAAVATLLALGAGALAGRTLWNPSELRVASRTGGGHATLQPDGIAFFDDKGSVIAMLQTDHGASRLSLSGTGGAGVQLSAHAIASLNLTANGNHSGLLSVGEHFSELNLTHGEQHVTLKTSKGLDASLGMSSGQDRGIVSLTNGGMTLSPRLQLSTNGAKHAVVLEAGPQEASVRVSDVTTTSRELTTKRPDPKSVF